MSIYLRKPVTVRAIKWSGLNEDEMFDFLKETSYMWYRNQITKTLVFDVWSDGFPVRVRIGDIIIRNEDDSMHITNDKCFNQNYELIEE